MCGCIWRGLPLPGRAQQTSGAQAILALPGSCPAASPPQDVAAVPATARPSRRSQEGARECWVAPHPWLGVLEGLQSCGTTRLAAHWDQLGSEIPCPLPNFHWALPLRFCFNGGCRLGFPKSQGQTFMSS